MKILIAVDGSVPSRAAARAVAARPWPRDSEFRLITVVQPPPWMPEPFMVSAEVHAEMQREHERRSRAVLEEVAAELQTACPGTPVTTCLEMGSPKEVLVEQAAQWGADLVVVGTHGQSPLSRFVLGSVAHAVALHAPCSVEIVRGAG